MKETVLDVLMYLFENYLDEEVVLAGDEDSLKLELSQAGFGHKEISKALEWLEGLTALSDNQAGLPVLTSQSSRIFTDGEMDKINTLCRGFLLFLEQVGVLDQTARELVIDRIMALEMEEIDLDTFKWVILMVLFNQPGQEAAYAWMEGLVLDDMANLLH